MAGPKYIEGFSNSIVVLLLLTGRPRLSMRLIMLC